MYDLEMLRQVMPPPPAPDRVVDWANLRQSWGRGFPADYRQFMQEYGNGTIDSHLVIVSPERKDATSDPSTGGMAQETATAELLWTDMRREDRLVGAEPLLIAWGGTDDADTLCWDASGDDPDTWPVLVSARGDAMWYRYDCGMVEFLLRVLRADFDGVLRADFDGVLRADVDDCPLSGAELWGAGTTRFLTRNEQKRLRKAGLDPWTGEPHNFRGAIAVDEQGKTVYVGPEGVFRFDARDQ